MSRRGHKVHVFAGKSGGPELRSFLERLIDKGQFRDALKQARATFRQDSSAENRLLLERITYLRADELARRGLQTEAKEAAHQLLDLGVTDANVLQDFVLLLPRLGLGEKAVSLQSRLTSPEAQAGLSAKLADRAVLRPEEVPASMSELRETAQRIRAALDELQAGNEPRALELLQDIPRSSPLAEWRYFVRGLAAFQRAAPGQAAANWERLDPARSAGTIAAVLQRTSPIAAAGDNAVHDLSRLEIAAFGEAVLGRLQRLGQALEESDWKQALQLLPALRTSLTRIDRRLAQRITSILLGPLSDAALSLGYQAGERLIRDFTRIAEPLPLDPHWHRLWALTWEQASPEPSKAISHWEQYARDMEQCETPLPVERHRLQAMVWRHIGMLYARSDVELNDDALFGPRRPQARSHEQQRLAVAALKKSLELDGKQRSTHELLMALHEDWKQPAGAAEAARGLLAAFPDDLPALERLIGHYLAQDEPESGLPLVLRARQLKPLDQTLVADEWAMRVALARKHALAKRFDEGRAELDRAAALDIFKSTPQRLLIRRTVLELKAGQPELAEECLRQAQAGLSEHAALWLQLAIEAARYKLPKAAQQRFQQQWKAAAKKKITGKTAGDLAEVLGAYVVADVNYPGRARHVNEVIDCLRRTTRTKYEEHDLARVCAFLAGFQDERLLTEGLTRRGLKLFPNHALFPLLTATQEMGRGPFGADIGRAKKMLERALQLAQVPGSPHAPLLSDIKRHLGLLSDLQEQMPPFAFGPPPGRGRNPFQEMIDSLLGLGGDDEVDDDDFYHAGPIPPRPSKSRKRK